MKRFLSIALSVLILTESILPAHDFHELIKLPALLEHYQVHRTDDPEISFLAFLLLHYHNPHHHDKDHATHHELPFSDHHKCTHGSQAGVLFHTVEITSATRLWLMGENSWCEISEILITSFATSIWQPPKA